MSDSLIFDSVTPRFGLPLLFVGQAQKEAYVNEAHALADAVMHCAVNGELPAPPDAARDGDCWLVASPASGAWAGQSGKIASLQGGNWLFITPRDGMRVLDRSTGQDRRFHGSWHRPAAPAAPSGGMTIDAEARSAIAALVQSLRQAGIFPS